MPIETVMTLLHWLTPWEPWPLVIAAFMLTGYWFAAGSLRMAGTEQAPNRWCQLAFWLGWASSYIVLQTHYDYYAQHMFWVHRLQHLILHHLSPLLLILANPGPVLRQGMPNRLVANWQTLIQTRVWDWLYRSLQNRLVAPVLFVGLIIYWLIPSVHFDAMLSAWRYELMNLSMLIDGLLFWYLIVGPEDQSRQGHHISFGARIVMLWLVMVAQIIIGASITFKQGELYDVYAVCGRAWPLSPLVDQQYGGLITWIPSAMMSVVAALIVIRRWRQSTTHGKIRAAKLTPALRTEVIRAP